jgi:1-deoxy-D-xylulose-5-phosphate synthase
MSLLDSIKDPSDLRKLPEAQLPQLAAEIRERMIDCVSQCGGHLASGLGVVELTVVLHYCYNTPIDKIVWDVGHQAYAHKILTGRNELFSTLRQFGGLSGFPRINESEYDPMSAGHASTAISAGLGLAIGRDLLKQKHHVVAVVGDGALSGGLAFEGMNNLGMQAATNMTIVLNDNEMSISHNVGAMSRYLTRVITDRRYNKIKDDVWELLGHLSDVGKRVRGLMHSLDEALKHFVIPGKLFEDMGLRYLGPVDGHNIPEMMEVFRYLRDSSRGPVLVHLLTKKGKGYTFAENDSRKFHGVGSFSPKTGAPESSTARAPTNSEIFGRSLVELAETNSDIVAITAAMPDGTGLTRFQERFPDRFFDVGIAEEHAVTFAAGLAAKGLKPVVALYSTFLQRAYDQIIHDIALDSLHVVFCIDRAGLVGDDGPTHHGMFDLSFLRTVPNVTIMAPSNGAELKAMLFTALLELKGPVFIRYPRGAAAEPVSGSEIPPIADNQFVVVDKGEACALIAAGEMVETGRRVRAALRDKGINATLINARFIKPLNSQAYRQLFSEYRHIVTLEANSLSGGFGSGVLELAAESPNPPNVLRLGLPDQFIPHGNVEILLKELGLDTESITNKVMDFLKS